MKIFIRILILILCRNINFLSSTLIIYEKNDQNEAVPLDTTNIEMMTMIKEIIQKYEWPMVIASASELSPEEKTKLFAEEPGAEERFIQQKINDAWRKLTDKEMDKYFVVWVPTTVYQLVALLTILKPIENSDEKNQRDSALKTMNSYKPKIIDIEKILNDFTLSSNEIKEEVYTLYKQANAEAFQDLYLYINNQCVEEIAIPTSPQHPLKESTAKNAARSLKRELLKIFRYDQEYQYTWSELTKSYTQFNLLSSFNDRSARRLPTFLKTITQLNAEQETKIIEKTIALEYKARATNKGILLRGSSVIDAQIKLGNEPPTTQLLGSSLLPPRKLKADSEYDTEPDLLESAYHQQTLKPFSISFGNGLFDGILNDITACSYHFLLGKRVYSDTSTIVSKSTGYSLNISKLDYINTQCNHLFFISPIAPLTGLFHTGEFFHSRSTAAIKERPTSPKRISGCFAIKLTDPANMILVERDPLNHAALFSQFIAEHGILIQTGDASTFTPEEKEFEKKVLANQTAAAKFYKTAQHLFTDLIPSAKKQYHEQRFSGQDDAVDYLSEMNKVLTRFRTTGKVFHIHVANPTHAVSQEGLIPASMQTEEITGAAAVPRDEKGFRIGRTGITLITCWHHERGDNQPADRFYIDQEFLKADRKAHPSDTGHYRHSIFPIIQQKKSNPENKPIIDEKMIVKLKYLAELVQHYFRTPMAIDFTINPDNKRILITALSPLLPEQELNKASIQPTLPDYASIKNLSLAPEFKPIVPAPTVRKQDPSTMFETSWQERINTIKIASRGDLSFYLRSLCDQVLWFINNTESTSNSPSDIITQYLTLIQQKLTPLLTNISKQQSKVARIKQRFYAQLLHNVIYQAPHPLITNTFAAAPFIFTNKNLDSTTFFLSATGALGSTLQSFIDQNPNVIAYHLKNLSTNAEAKEALIQKSSNKNLPTAWLSQTLVGDQSLMPAVLSELLYNNTLSDNQHNMNVLTSYIIDNIDNIPPDSISDCKKIVAYFSDNEQYKPLINSLQEKLNPKITLSQAAPFPEIVPEIVEPLTVKHTYDHTQRQRPVATLTLFTIFINKKDRAHNSALDLANQYKHHDVITLLKEYGAIES